MIAPILATKLYIPPVSSKAICRPRLVERLDEGLNRKLTLISAPAGFGKTTLVSEWVTSCNSAERQFRTAWLSLDDADSDPVRFLTYLVAALQEVSPDIGEEVFGLLQSAQFWETEHVLNILLNKISRLAWELVLVLDDYHAIDSKAVDQAVTYLIEHLPPQMHLLITTREDPQLPLARLRAGDQLSELRAADLRFIPTEAVAFLQGIGIDLSAEEAAALDDRTEGWIAGLQLAALAIQGGKNVPGFLPEFIHAFAGDHRYIMDYLVEEVLYRQPEPVRNFLLQTAILDRLHGPLCDAVTGQTGGSARLENLQRGNFFVIPLDDRRQWYRYHHLFADVLKAQLHAEQPGAVAVLHGRASAWYEQHGAVSEAIRHALAAEDFARAATLIEKVFPAMARSRQETTLLGWLKALPEALLRDRPVLCNLLAGVLMQTGEMEGVDAWLRAAEHWLTPTGDAQPAQTQTAAMVVVDEEQFRRLPGAVAVHRAGEALMQGNIAETIRHARQALTLAPEDDPLRRGGAAALLGLAFWTLGDLDAARQIYPESIVTLQKAGHLADATGCALALADILITQGRLGEAMGVYQEALKAASDRGEPDLRGTVDMLVGMSELYYERNDLHLAAQCLQKSHEQGEHSGLPQSRYRWRVAMARLRAVEGDPDGALALLDEAERLYMSDFSPNVRPVAAVKARMWAAQGRLEEALSWARKRKITAQDDPSYLREYEHLTLARILLASFQRDRVTYPAEAIASLLDRLLAAAGAGGRVRSVIEILILQALLYQAQGDLPAALAPLQQVLVLAEPEEYIRLFIDEGSPMERLLREASARKIHPHYAGRLLAAFEDAPRRSRGEASIPPAAPMPQKPLPSEGKRDNGSLAEALSQRELEVLRLFRTELSGPEIAQELMVALSTVRTHTKSIYSKLNVNSRRAAVRRAGELHLI